VDEASEAIGAHQLAARNRPRLGGRAGQLLLKPLMRSSAMVVLEERRQYPLQMSSAEDQEVIQALPPCCADDLSAMEFARGARTGRRTILTPSLRKTSPNAAVNLESRSLRRNLAERAPSWSFHARLRACCTTTGAAGPSRQADAAGVERPRQSPIELTDEM